MTNSNPKKTSKNGLNPVVVAVAGAIVGAGVAVAGAAVLKDKKNREKVKAVLSNVKDQAVEYMEDMQEQARDKKVEVEGKLIEETEKIKKVADSAKKSLDRGIQDAKKAAR